MATRYVSSSASGSGDGTSEAAAWTLAQWAANGLGHTTNIKTDGVYTLTAGLTAAMNGSYSAPSKLIAYTTTPGDGGQVTIRAGANSVTLFTVNSSADLWFEGITFDGNRGTFTGTALFAFGGSDWSRFKWVRCKFINSGGGGLASGLNDWHLYRCIAANNVGAGFGGFRDGQYEECVAFDNGGDGFVGSRSDGNSTSHVRCISFRNAGDGFDSAATNQRDSYAHCTAHGNTGNGFAAQSGATGAGPLFVNNVASGNGSRGYSVYNSSLVTLAANNAEYNNTSGPSQPSGLASVSLLAAPFDATAIAALTTSSTIADVFAAFTPNNTAGAGALLRGAASVANLDIGAAQHQDSGGGGGSTFSSRGILTGGRL